MATQTTNTYSDQSVQIIECPSGWEKTGHSFKEWNTAADGSGTKYTPNQYVWMNGNETLYAQWQPNTYTITLNPNGGSVSPSTLSIIYGGTFSGLPTPTKPYNSFQGWYTEIAEGNLVTSESTMNVAADMTLYARWTVNMRTITFNSNGGSAVAAITQGAGTRVTAPTNPTKSGYIFGKWNPAVPSIMPDRDMTCTAVWRLRKVSKVEFQLRSTNNDASWSNAIFTDIPAGTY